MRRHAVTDAGGIALSEASVTYAPLIAGEPTQLSLTFTSLAAIALNETVDLVFSDSLFIPNYTLPKSVDRKFSWVSKNTTEQSLEDDSPDFSVTWVPDRVFPRLRFRASRLLDAGTYTVGLTSSKLLELPAGGLHADDARITLASDARALGAVSGFIPTSPAVGAFGATSLAITSEDGGRTYGGGRCRISLKFSLGPGYASAGDVITLALDVAGPDDEAYLGAPLVSSGFSVSIVENAIQLTVLSDDDDIGGGAGRIVTVSNLVLARGGVAQDSSSITLTSSSTHVPTTAIPVLKTTAVAGISDVAWTCLPEPCSLDVPSEWTLALSYGSTGTMTKKLDAIHRRALLPEPQRLEECHAIPRYRCRVVTVQGPLRDDGPRAAPRFTVGGVDRRRHGLQLQLYAVRVIHKRSKDRLRSFAGPAVARGLGVDHTKEERPHGAATRVAAFRPIGRVGQRAGL